MRSVYAVVGIYLAAAVSYYLALSEFKVQGEVTHRLVAALFAGTALVPLAHVKDKRVWAAIVIAIGIAVVLFRLYGPRECFQFLQTAILGAGACYGIVTWRVEIAKRRDVFQQQLYAKQLALYAELAEGVGDLIVAFATDKMEEAVRAHNKLTWWGAGGLAFCNEAVNSAVKRLKEAATAAAKAAMSEDASLNAHVDELMPTAVDVLEAIRETVYVKPLSQELSELIRPLTKWSRTPIEPS